MRPLGPGRPSKPVLRRRTLATRSRVPLPGSAAANAVVGVGIASRRRARAVNAGHVRTLPGSARTHAAAHSTAIRAKNGSSEAEFLAGLPTRPGPTPVDRREEHP